MLYLTDCLAFTLNMIEYDKNSLTFLSDFCFICKLSQKILHSL